MSPGERGRTRSGPESSCPGGAGRAILAPAREEGSFGGMRGQPRSRRVAIPGGGQPRSRRAASPGGGEGSPRAAEPGSGFPLKGVRASGRIQQAGLAFKQSRLQMHKPPFSSTTSSF